MVSLGVGGGEEVLPHMLGLRAARIRGRCAPRALDACFLLIGLAAPAAMADQVSMTAAKDNTLFSSAAGDLSSGAGPFLFCGLSGGQIGDPIQHRAVLAFDLSGIPAGSTVTSVTLSLVLIQASPFGNEDDLTLHRLTADWGEGTSQAFGGMGVPATAGDVTWLHTFYPNQFWTTQGGDFLPQVTASQVVGTAAGSYSWGPTPAMIADVQGWLNNPATSFGWVLLGDEVALFSAKKFGSSEGDVPFRPRLTIIFTPPPPCPWDCDGSDDGNVNVSDLLALLSQYDPDAPAVCDDGEACDYDGDGCVDVNDLLKLLTHYTTDPGGIGCP